MVSRLMMGLLLLGLGACGGSVARPDDGWWEAAEVVAQVEERLEQVADLRIVAKVDYRDLERRERVVGRDVVISAKAPSLLRVTLSSFDKALATLVTDGNLFQLLDVQQNTYFHGPATPRNLGRLLPLNLSAGDFYRVLAGAFPVALLSAEWPREAVLGWNGKTGCYVLDLPREAGGRLLVELEHPSLNIVEMRIVEAGKVVYVYKARDFVARGGAQLPQRVRFEIGDDEIDVTLRVERVDVNVDPKAQVFSLPPPPGIEQIHVVED